MNKFLFNKAIIGHITNLFNFYNLGGKIKFKDVYLEDIILYPDKMDFYNLYGDNYFIWKKIESYKDYIPSDYDTLTFIFDNKTSYVLKEILGEDNFNDLINVIEEIKQEKNVKKSTFEERYYLNI